MLGDLQWHWLLWLLLLIPAFYLLMPLAIWPMQRFPAHPEIEELDSRVLRKSLRHFLMTQASDLLELGFAEPTMAEVPGPPMVTAYVIMLVNRKTGDKAMVTALVARGPSTMRTVYLEFSTRFESGEVFDTLNATELSAFPPDPQTIRTQVPAVIDPEELYDLHRFVIRKHGVASRKTLYAPGEGLNYLVDQVLIAEYEQQVDRGWLYYDARHDVYRPTLKGIYLICWGLLQPRCSARWRCGAGRRPSLTSSTVTKRRALAYNHHMADPGDMARDPKHRRRFEKLLHLAAQRGDADLVAERLSWGVDPNCASPKGRTPLIANVGGFCPSAATVKALLAAGADASLMDHAGLTALDYARRKLARLQMRPPTPRRKSPSLDENDQLHLSPDEQAELDKMREQLGPVDYKDFFRIWWQERLRAARRVFNDPEQIEKIVEILEAAAEGSSA
ncbi:MAG: ankyrin repeat domain-containing protein [Gemmataceae bacterium]|nr:ankyrin repeat domain-containing protein [Gemmataceae bacterium]